MPYIRPGIRHNIDPTINYLIKDCEDQIGESRAGLANYIITRTVIGLLGPEKGKKWSYFMILVAMGTFLCAGLELYRRIAGPKEDQAIILNGDLEEYESK